MIIKKLQVEEGFLNGLNLDFNDGLNVIIGPRGSGKTSIIELIRYVLGVESYSQKFRDTSREHALAVLGSGQVILTIDDNGNEYSILRTADEAYIQPNFNFELPIILSQNEIETIGLSEPGKLGLIDSFSKFPGKRKSEEVDLLSEIKSFTAQLSSLSNEIQNINDQIDLLKGIDKEIKEVKGEQKKVSETVKSIIPQQEELAELAKITTELSVQSQIFERNSLSIKQWLDELQKISKFPPSIEKLSIKSGDQDLSKDVSEIFQQGIKHLSSAIDLINKAYLISIKHAETAKQERIRIDSNARELRKQIEVVQEGAGKIARRLADLSEKKGQRDALINLKDERISKLGNISSLRNGKLNILDKIREERFNDRLDIISKLNKSLSPNIEIRAVQSALFSDYENSIIEALRGSGLKYSSLAPQIAKSLSPRELALAVEEANPSVISNLADISIDRANKIIAYVREAGVENILTSNVEDGILMSLLVGSRYKQIETVSTGQRCTIILPILLCDHGRTLIIDQPEDHLDNAYIVHTVIKSIKNASKKNQIICTTHNPNIPVLGEASLVVLLDSDGTRGFVRNSNHLDHPSTIDAITTVMEGGREAFQIRADFYRKAN